MNKSKGFTLIELLVVVAIIGILATVVLASLGSARTKAKDTAARTALSQLRAEMELRSIDNGANGYREGTSGNACLTNGSKKFIDEANKQRGGAAVGNAVCQASTTHYAARVELSTGEWFCVDSNGYAAAVSTQAFVVSGNDIKCPAA